MHVLDEEAGAEIPLEFDPHEAEGIADELRALAEGARAAVQGDASARQHR